MELVQIIGQGIAATSLVVGSVAGAPVAGPLNNRFDRRRLQLGSAAGIEILLAEILPTRVRGTMSASDLGLGTIVGSTRTLCEEPLDNRYGS